VERADLDRASPATGVEPAASERLAAGWRARRVVLPALVLGRTAVIDWQDWQPGDMRRTWATIDKANRMLGYAPTTEFDEGLQLFADWLDETLAAERA